MHRKARMWKSPGDTHLGQKSGKFKIGKFAARRTLPGAAVLTSTDAGQAQSQQTKEQQPQEWRLGRTTQARPTGLVGIG